MDLQVIDSPWDSSRDESIAYCRASQGTFNRDSPWRWRHCSTWVAALQQNLEVGHHFRMSRCRTESCKIQSLMSTDIRGSVYVDTEFLIQPA